MAKKLTKKSVKQAKPRNLNNFMDTINKQFGINALVLAKDIVPFASTTKISTGSISLDIALGGGIPVGRFIHLSGMESCFKSTIMYHSIANAQKMINPSTGEPLTCLLIQSETGSFTADYGEQVGIDVDRLYFNQCEGMEEGLEIILQAQKTGLVNYVCIDSLESLVPTKEYDSAMMDTVQMGIKPKLMGEFFRKFSAINNKLLREGNFPCTLLGINQLREKIGAYGDAYYNPGGNASKFHASIEVRFRKGDIISIGEGVNKYIIGQVIKFKVNKNKVDVPLKVGSFDIYFDEGGVVPAGFVDNYKEIVLEGIMYNIIEKSGSWFSYKDLKVQGTDSLIKELKDREDLFEEIKERLMEDVEDDIIEED